MSQQLEQLREEFEAARDAWLDGLAYSASLCAGAGGTAPRRYLYRRLTEWTADDWCHADGSRFDEPDAMLEAARRYVIARDFGVFDPKEADMLWKLQNGGAV